MTLTLPLIVEFDRDRRSVAVEITEDMIPQQIEMEKGDTIRFRDFLLTVSQAGIYEIGAHGVKQLGLREEICGEKIREVV